MTAPTPPPPHAPGPEGEWETNPITGEKMVPTPREQVLLAALAASKERQTALEAKVIALREQVHSDQARVVQAEVAANEAEAAAERLRTALERITRALPSEMPFVKKIAREALAGAGP